MNTVKVDGLAVNTTQGGALDILSDGAHTVRVEAIDPNGLLGFAEVTFTVDSVLPVVTITSPAAGLMNHSTPVVSFEVNKSGTINVLYVDGTIVNKTSGETLNPLADGIHKLRVEVTDIYGYKAFAERSFTIDTTRPSGDVVLKFSRIAAGEYHSLAVASNGTLWAWGANGNGQLGDNTAVDKHVPVQIGQDGDWAVVAAGGSFSMALKTDGSLWAWGANWGGQLGNGTTSEEHTPTRIGDARDWVAISAGGGHAAAIKLDGRLFMWGSNNRGQIGNATYNNVYQPAEISSPMGPVWAISLGGVHSIAFADGMVWTWGDNWFNQLARFSCVPFFEPGPIEFGAWAQLSAGNEHTIALRPDGTLWAWGNNANCTLGNYTMWGSSMIPLPIGTDTDWQSISAGGSLNGALKSDGSLWTWGAWSTPYGGCSPVRKGTGTDWIAVSAGGNHGLALVSDGTVLSWGDNTYGQLGDGTTQGWSDPHPITATLGARPPIQINNGASVAGSVTVTLTLFAWDAASAVNSMQFSNDNTSWTDPEPYGTTKTWALITGDGLKTVSVKFQDAAGNWSVPFSATIQLIVGAPDVTITSPKGGLTKNNTQMLTYAAGEGTVVVKVDGTPVNKVSGDTLGPFQAGPHTIRVEVKNTANITGFAETTFTVVTTAPTVTITSPITGLTNNMTPILTYTVSDGTVVVKVDGIAIKRASGDRLDALSEGSHTVRVEAMDAAGNTGYAEVIFTIDTVPPTVTIYSPSAEVTNNNTPALSFNPVEGVPVVKVDNVRVNKVSGDTLDALSEGSHTVRVEAMDAAGNTGYAEVTFTVDAASAGNDDTNIYCMGTGTVLVGPSTFTNGISVPTANNTVFIASPVNEFDDLWSKDHCQRRYGHDRAGKRRTCCSEQHDRHRRISGAGEWKVLCCKSAGHGGHPNDNGHCNRPDWHPASGQRIGLSSDTIKRYRYLCGADCGNPDIKTERPDSAGRGAYDASVHHESHYELQLGFRRVGYG